MSPFPQQNAPFDTGGYKQAADVGGYPMQFNPSYGQTAPGPAPPNLDSGYRNYPTQFNPSYGQTAPGHAPPNPDSGHRNYPMQFNPSYGQTAPGPAPFGPHSVHTQYGAPSSVPLGEGWGQAAPGPMHPGAGGGPDALSFMQRGPYGQAAPGQEAESMRHIYEGAVDVQYQQPRMIDQRLVEVRNQVQQCVQPTYVYEKTVEVPQVVVKEFERYVRKPEIIERIIEMPKTEIVERTVTLPPQVQYQEQLVEVPQVIIEERVIHVPYTEVQERLIEVPKIEFVERIEYDTYVEYREVMVDRIVEVPQIEYIERQVEHFVPQTFVEEYYVDKYVEYPVTQVQEVERIEEVPMVPQAGMAPPPRMPGGQFYGVPPGMAQPQMAPWQSNIAQSYAGYDPCNVPQTRQHLS